MRLDPGTQFGTLSTATTAMLEVPETATYRSADGKVSRRYRAGDRVSREEFAFLQMGGVEIAGDVLEGVETTLDGDPGDGIQAGGVDPEQGDETPVDGAEAEPDAKAEPKPSNKKAPAPENKSE